LNRNPDDHDTNAGQDSPLLEPAAIPPVGIPSDVTPIGKLDATKQQKVRELMTKIDMNDIHSIIAFGVEAQRELTAAADRMIDGVRNKETGPVGEALGDLMLEVRGLGISDLKPNEKPGVLRRVLLRNVHPVARFIQQYEMVQHQIDSIVAKLEQHRGHLLRDVTMLDKMYESSLAYLGALELYIIAAVEKLRQIDREVLPEMKAQADRSGDVLDAQNLSDMMARRDDLERRIHDLRLTRQVTMQSLPQIRMIQDVDKSLLSKIQSSVLTTIPVWKSQITMTIALWNQQEVLKVQKAVTDTTNEMLARNAELLRMGTAEARKEIERGIFDIETVRKVNEQLISTIKESIRIAEEGRLKRVAAEAEMQRLENDLKQALLESRGMS